MKIGFLLTLLTVQCHAYDLFLITGIGCPPCEVMKKKIRDQKVRECKIVDCNDARELMEGRKIPQLVLIHDGRVYRHIGVVDNVREWVDARTKK